MKLDFGDIESGLENEIFRYVRGNKIISKGKTQIQELCDRYYIENNDDAALNFKRESIISYIQLKLFANNLLLALPKPPCAFNIYSYG